MSCSNPSLAVDLGVKENGKRAIKFLPHRVDFSYQNYLDKYGDSLLAIPCGKCEGCVLARRKMWSLRCYCESLYHEKNCFVTLTYDQKNCPEHLIKKDFQDFIKGLRNKGLTIRYFGCGEYGGQTGRPHYHLVLFGYFPEDAVFYSKTKSGFYQFTSKVLSSVWSKGFVTVTEFTPEIAAYTAGYVDKKYKQNDCFILMSKRPGLGEQYFLDHFEDIYKNDSLVVNYGSHVARIPKYFDKLAEKIGFDISDLKDNRIDQMNYFMYKELRSLSLTRFEELLKKRNYDNKNKLDQKKRCL